jgi:predicted RND superfamily exporter protein
LRVVKSQLASQRPLTIEEAPPTLVDRFRERDGTIGRIAVITAKPEAKLELGPNLNNFAAAVRNVPVQGRLYDAAGENVVLADLLENIAHEGPLTTFLSLVGVCILVVALFRSARASVLVITTLITGVVLMAGVAVAFGLKINFFNFIVYPITFGVAVDYGANVVARIRERGGNVLVSLVEVGPAVALCSWTSMIGYSSLLHATNRALRSFGWYAVIGEFTSILSALLLLPALRLLIPAKVIVPAPEQSQEHSS